MEAATPETGRKHGGHSSVAGHAETVRGASPGRGPPDRGYSAGSFIGEARRWCATCRYKACAHAGIAMFLRWAEAFPLTERAISQQAIAAPPVPIGGVDQIISQSDLTKAGRDAFLHMNAYVTMQCP